MKTRVFNTLSLKQKQGLIMRTSLVFFEEEPRCKYDLAVSRNAYVVFKYLRYVYINRMRGFFIHMIVY